MTNHYVFFRQNGVLKKIDVDEIVLLHTADNYLKIFARDITFTVRATLEAVLGRMPPKKFLRVHRQYAVSIDYIEKIERDELILTDKETSIPVSKQYYRNIIKQIVILDTEIPKKRADNYMQNPDEVEARAGESTFVDPAAGKKMADGLLLRDQPPTSRA
jgi:LytTr DNA-binding domain